MTLRYPSANAHAVELEANGVDLHHHSARGENPTGVKITPPPIEYPMETVDNLEDRLLALARLDPELELEED